ncbi:MAG: ATP-binding cassette domain-containing protein [Bacteroidetes bacterium]|jgi:ABC-type lipoprotein export system ATPase subunit|nr:ATP-binding cassette domain-containing protein [Bacteroidota bacterium]
MPDPSAAAVAVEPTDAATPLIHLEAVSKIYPMGHTEVAALHDATLSIRQGEFVGVVGRSGSGKSTLLHLLAAMDQPTTGTIRVGTWTLNALDRRAQARYRREMVGMIFQQFNLIPSMTARENVALPLVLAGAAPDARLERAEACLRDVGLGHRLDHRPTELSGGEQQRVAIARAFVHDPPILLADEPTGNLDSTTGAQIIDVLARVHREQGRTVLVVTHHPDEIADVAERVVSLHDGALRVE